MEQPSQRDHGGGLDAAARVWGGQRTDWLDLSTGINPVTYPVGDMPCDAWTALPDKAVQTRVLDAARAFWRVPKGAAVLAVPGASAAIAHIPRLAAPASVHIPGPTYNEHAASFTAAGWQMARADADATVLVHPNNPDGRLWQADALRGTLRVIDESFCDVTPAVSLIDEAAQAGTLILKSFGKFWGLAGLRLGFVIGDPALVARIEAMLGPWPVSGPALSVGARALRDPDWANTTRTRLQRDADRLDAIMTDAGAQIVGGTTLFRLYEVEDAQGWQDRLAAHRIWSRVFPYNTRWLRLGLPGPDGWSRLEQALS